MKMATEVLDGDADTFRKLWRGFGSTVTLIATEDGGTRYAMLATAASSMSMEPPSLLICVNQSASAYGALQARGAFSLGILAHQAEAVAGAIGRASGEDRFAHGDWRALDAPGRATDGLPWLAEAQATLFCVTDQTFDYGTHTGFIARIDRAIGGTGGDPLLYCDGRYGRFNGDAR
ncbi:MAG TPA: flavin reductase family protein [Paenirhodobacter sp.]